jgi:hypothetical protein
MIVSLSVQPPGVNELCVCVCVCTLVTDLIPHGLEDMTTHRLRLFFSLPPLFGPQY